MSAATGVSLTAPATPAGLVNKASANFTVALTPGGGTNAGVVVTPTPVAGCVFTPTTVTLSTGTPSATFTVTPSTAGVKTIAITNGGALSNPSSVTYDVVSEEASAPAPVITDSSTFTTDPKGNALYTFNGSLDIVLTSTDSEALIYYTLDGTTPNPGKGNGAVGPVDITLTKATQLQVVTVAGGLVSPVTVKRYALEG
jgi:hypothetical protein